MALLHGHNPYHVHLPDGAPVSPGPGWIAVVTPLVLLHVSAAIAAVTLAVAVFAAPRPAASGGLLCLLMLLQPHFLSQAAGGGDLYAIILLLGAWIVALFDRDLTTRRLVLLACAGGVLATARLALLPIVLVPCLALARKQRRAGLLTALLVTATAMLLDVSCALWSHAEHDVFQPMHIFHRGEAALILSMKLLSLCLLVPAILYVLRWMRGTASSALLGTALVLGAVFVPVGLGELARTHLDAGWEGCNYVLLFLPLLAMWLVETRPHEILSHGNVQTHPSQNLR